MESINKFKVFTIIIFCTFVFAIAAMYINTKDVTDDKTGTQKESVNSEDEYSRRENVNSSVDMSGEIRNIYQRLDELNAKIDNSRRQDSKSNANNLKCRIAGTLGARGMEEMSPNAAINDARINKNDLVVLCSF